MAQRKDLIFQGTSSTQLGFPHCDPVLVQPAAHLAGTSVKTVEHCRQVMIFLLMQYND